MPTVPYLLWLGSKCPRSLSAVWFLKGNCYWSRFHRISLTVCPCRMYLFYSHARKHALYYPFRDACSELSIQDLAVSSLKPLREVQQSNRVYEVHCFDQIVMVHFPSLFTWLSNCICSCINASPMCREVWPILAGLVLLSILILAAPVINEVWCDIFTGTAELIRKDHLTCNIHRRTFLSQKFDEGLSLAPYCSQKQRDCNFVLDQWSSIINSDWRDPNHPIITTFPSDVLVSSSTMIHCLSSFWFSVADACKTTRGLGER